MEKPDRFGKQDMWYPMYYCPDTSDHILERKEEWNDKEQCWFAWSECIKCGQKIGNQPLGCSRSKDKIHQWDKGHFIAPCGTLVKWKKCSNCNTFIQAEAEKFKHFEQNKL